MNGDPPDKLSSKVNKLHALLRFFFVALSAAFNAYPAAVAVIHHLFSRLGWQTYHPSLPPRQETEKLTVPANFCLSLLRRQLREYRSSAMYSKVAVRN